MLIGKVTMSGTTIHTAILLLLRFCYIFSDSVGGQSVVYITLKTMSLL